MRFLWWGQRPKATYDPMVIEREGRYVTVGGRRRVRDIPYALPNDIAEHKRLDLQHFLVRQTLRGNYAAPLDPRTVHEILDIGSGTGRWGMEMARDFPRANVVGVDPADPAVDMGAILGYGLDQKPDNYVFVRGDVLKGLEFADQSFDYVHMRFLVAAIPAEQWQRVVEEVIRVTKVGGWIELMEASTVSNTGPVMTRTQEISVEAIRRRGITVQAATAIAQYLEHTQQVRVTIQQHIHWPMGKLFGRFGQAAKVDLYSGQAACVPLVRAVMGEDRAQEYEQLLGQWQAEADTTRPLWNVYLAVGQRIR